ncbi:hypothetical protein C0J52_08923 [Blattella germanica]|nr:hypothetical protein C0J52_08923 [Blattella germanica]
MDINDIESEFINKCKLLSLDVQNHSKLIETENFLEMLAVSLVSSEPSISKTAVETLYILLQRKSNLSAIISTKGLLEAVNFACERLTDEKTLKLAKNILYVLTGPAYGTRSLRKKQQLLEEQGKTHLLTTKQIVLHIDGINTVRKTGWING